MPGESFPIRFLAIAYATFPVGAAEGKVIASSPAARWCSSSERG